jgi:hypothetical protein
MVLQVVRRDRLEGGVVTRFFARPERQFGL